MFIRATRQTFTWLCAVSLLTLGAASCGDNLPSKSDALSGGGGMGGSGSTGTAGSDGGGAAGTDGGMGT
ncbi:MAG TPA: hypothetical protein VHG72_05135, partial [Polyangia bacterium]|nr:hypothetical protein [Polyangia bacterium]